MSTELDIIRNYIAVMIWIVHPFVTVHEDTIYDGYTFREMPSSLQMFLWNAWEFYFPIFERKNFEHKFTPVILLLSQCKLRAIKVKSR